MCSTKQRLAAVLREQRTLRGWTLRQAAERACLAPSTLSRWESGTCLPRVPELESLLVSLGAGRRDIVRILSSLDAPRATRAVRLRSSESFSEPMAPRGGDFLRLLRHRAGLTLTHVAKTLGVAASTVSRWEASVAHPSTSVTEALMELLQATPEERACFGVSGVAKIKSDRPVFDAELYENELAALDARLATEDRDGCELRLLQIQSNLWWSLAEPKAPELMRRSRVLFAELLVCDQRLNDAEVHAEAALESSSDAFDLWGVRAQRIIARVETYRGPIPRPHLGMLVLQRCLQESKDDISRAYVLHDLAELSLVSGRVEEAESYARRAHQAAVRSAPSTMVLLTKELLQQIETEQSQSSVLGEQGCIWKPSRTNPKMPSVASHPGLAGTAL